MPNPSCSHCSGTTIKHGIQRGTQYFYCEACKRAFADSDRSVGRPRATPEGFDPKAYYKDYQQDPEKRKANTARQRARRQRLKKERGKDDAIS